MMVWDVAILVEFIMTWNWFKDDTLVLWCLYDFKIRNFQTSPSNPFSFPLSLQNHPSLIPQPPSPIQWGHRSGHLWGTQQEPAEPGPHRCGPHHLRDAGAAAWATGRAWNVAMRSTLLVDDFYLGEHTNLYLGDSNIPPAESLFIPVYDTSKSATHWRKVSLSLPAVSHDDPGGAWIELPERGLKQVETQNLSAFKGASITSYHIETRRFWICLNNSQYLAKQQDQVWMVQAPHFPGPKEDKSQMHSNARWAFASSTITTRAMAQSQRCLGKDWDVRWHRSKCP